MKRVYYQNPGDKKQLLFDPRAQLPIENLILTREVGCSGSLELTIYPTHRAYNHLKHLITYVTVEEDGDEIFRGRMISSEEDLRTIGKVACEGDLAFFFDSVLRPYDFTGGIEAYLKMVVDNHNSQVEARKQFKIGTITVTDANDYIARSNTGFSKSLDALRDKLIGTHGGYLRTRKDGEDYCLDYVVDYDGINVQPIRFGENLLDLTKYVDASKIITALIPTGASEKKGSTTLPVDISSVNNGLDYIYDEQAVQLYGWIWGDKNWNDVTQAANLLKKAKEYLQQVSALPATMQLNAVDLYYAGIDIQQLQIGYWTDVISEKNGVKGQYILSKMENHLDCPEEDVIVIGGTITSLTSGNVASKKTTGQQIQSALNNKPDMDIQPITDDVLESLLK